MTAATAATPVATPAPGPGGLAPTPETKPDITIDLSIPMTMIEAASLALEWMQRHGASRFDTDEATDLRPEVVDQLRTFAVPLSYLRFANRKFVTVSACRKCHEFMVIGSGGAPPTKCALTRDCDGTMSPKAKKDATAKARLAASLIEPEPEPEDG